MHAFGRPILVFILLLPVWPAHALAVGETDPVYFEQRFAFSTEQTTTARVTNDYLQMIARGSGKLRAYTAYHIGAEMAGKWEAVKPGKTRFYLEMRRFSFSGDFLYRDFGLESVLMPDLISFDLLVTRSRTNETVFQQHVSRIPLCTEKMVSEAIDLPIVIDPGLQVQIRNVRLDYSPGAPASVANWLQALQEYYVAAELLEAARVLLQDLQTNDPTTLMLDEFRLCEAGHLLGKVRYASFHRWIDVEKHDPAQVYRDFKALSVQADSLREAFNEAISRIDEMFYEAAGAACGSGRPKEALGLYRQALVYNPFHVPSHLALVEHQTDSLQKVAALQRLGEVFGHMYPHPGERLVATHLAGRLLELFYGDSEEFMSGERYLEALSLLEEVRLFCENAPGLALCQDGLTQRMASAHKGMFFSFLTVAEKAMQIHRLELAESYLRSAMDYSQMHSRYLTDRYRAMFLLQQLVNRLRMEAWAGDDTEGHERALMSVERLLSLCRDYPFLVCPHDLEERHEALRSLIQGTPGHPMEEGID